MNFITITLKENINPTLLFTDTDSLVYAIRTDDNYKDVFEGKTLFNFSYYPQDSKFFDLSSKKINGKTKDEFKEKTIFWIKVED